MGSPLNELLDNEPIVVAALLTTDTSFLLTHLDGHDVNFSANRSVEKKDSIVWKLDPTSSSNFSETTPETPPPVSHVQCALCVTPIVHHPRRGCPSGVRSLEREMVTHYAIGLTQCKCSGNKLKKRKQANADGKERKKIKTDQGRDEDPEDEMRTSPSGDAYIT